MNRRDFARLSALTAVATQVPAFAQATPPRKIGYAAVGLGTISDLFMRSIANSETVQLTALVSGHPDKAARYAEKYNIPKESIYSYESYDRLKENKAVDAVYLGLPNSMHREYTERAASAGKHVLCEKPMAISSAECRAMVDACKKASVKLLIAYRCHYDPTYIAARELLRSGALGEIQAFESAFGFDSRPNLWRLTKKFGGGGPLLDVGIYSLNAIRYFTGEEPSKFTAIAATRDHTSGRFKEVEQNLSWTMQFPSGIVAACNCSYGSSMPGFLNVHGTRGSLFFEEAFGGQGIHVHGSYSVPDGHANQTVDLLNSGKDPFQLQLEGEHLAKCILNNTEPWTPGEEGLRDLEAIEKIYAAAGTPIA